MDIQQGSSLLVILILFAGLWFRQVHRINTIPGPKLNPIVGLGMRLPSDSTTLFYKWAIMYGEIFRVKVGWYDWVIINSPEAIREILEKQAVVTSSKAPSPLGHDVVTGGMRMPTMPYGPRWRAQRSVVRQITSAQMAATFVPTQEFEMMQLLFDLAMDNQDQKRFYMHMRRYAFSIVFTNVFGIRIPSVDHAEVQRAMQGQAILRKTLPPYFIVDELPLLQMMPKYLQPGRREAKQLAKVVRDLKMNLWQRLEREFEAGAAPACYGREILAKKGSWYEQGLTGEDLAWVAGGLVEAGFETSAATLNGLILYLAANPHVQQKAHDQLLEVTGPNRCPKFADIPNLPYIRACVKEMLRLNPILTPGIRHFTEADVVYKNHIIPKGTVLLLNTAFLHFDPSRYKDPYQFQPERYLKHDRYSAEYAAMGDPYQRDHFTFSTGRRACPGARLAENSLCIALAGVLWAFEIRPPTENSVEKPIDLGKDAFTQSGFAVPKPFQALFVPRDAERLEIVKEQWHSASREGYVLRGEQVNIDGIIRNP